jgi:hypothetical protein
METMERLKYLQELETRIRQVTDLLQHPGWKLMEGLLDRSVEALMLNPVASGEKALEALAAIRANRDLKTAPLRWIEQMKHELELQKRNAEITP